MNKADIRWKGVRPVRFSEEIFEVLKLVVNNKLVTIQEIKETLKQCREVREQKRLRAIRNQVPIRLKKRQRAEFLTKAEQFVRVLKRIKLIETDKDKIKPTEKCIDIIKTFEMNNELEAKSKFLEVILNSKFESYKLFLFQILKNPCIIPKNFSARNKELRSFLSANGFYLDVWSFFILKDFFYSFGLLNYIFKPDHEEIFPTCAMNESVKKWEQKIHVDNKIIYYWKKINLKEFVLYLGELYLEMTNNTWNKVVSLVELREKFSKKHNISDFQFNTLLSNLQNKKFSIKIVPSVGIVKRENRTGYLTKLVHMPMNKNELPFTLLRLGP